MIRLLFVFVTALLAIAAGEEQCIPGQLFQQGCNTCICSKDGRLAACTLIECQQEVEKTVDVEQSLDQLSCEPGSSYNDYCNVCACNKDGNGYTCTEMECDKNIINKDGTLKLAPQPHISRRVGRRVPRQVCQPGARFQQDCNGCVCSSDGTTAYCTLMACPSYGREFGSLRARRQANEQTCTPNEYFKDYCNTCYCGEDGRAKSCTEMHCNKSFFNQDGSLRTESQVLDSTTAKPTKVCDNSSLTSLDGICNFCICNKNGTEKACTKSHCSSSLIKAFEEEEKWGPLYKEGDSCIPSKGFYSECNQCVCRPDGRSAFCTLTTCSP